ncbi:MAG: UDP-N-acetylmuramoyl-L-alanyl-D-glutamate--2,6-diaminopimelate ligase [Actinomycetes bacterium]
MNPTTGDGVALTTAPVRLASVLQEIGLDVGPAASATSVTGITLDSRLVEPGMLFAALPGHHQHGAAFAAAAAASGAVAILTDAAGAEQVSASLPVVVVADPRSVLGQLSAAVYGFPSAAMLTFGVTGTNGKTTTTWLLEAALRRAGHTTGLVGTVETHVAGAPLPSLRTTPEAPQLQALLAMMRDASVSAVALEISSHALAAGRVDGLVVDVAGFTNLGRDHLDFHGTAQAYEAAKQRLLTPEHSRQAVVVVDDDGGRRAAAASRVPTQTLSVVGSELGADRAADWQVPSVVAAVGGPGSTFVLRGPDGSTLELTVRLPGRFNVANAALAAAMLLVAGVEPAQVSAGIEACRGVPGRMEPVDRGQSFVALVDYAHTPDALAAVLSGVRPRTSGRLLVVIGCGGDRDVAKRPDMGAVAARLAEWVAITDDNPRSEDPAAIRRAMIAGAEAAGATSTVLEIADRAEAIAEAVAQARPGDTVVVAGKGHEQGQEVAGAMLPFDDRAVLAAALEAREVSSR